MKTHTPQTGPFRWEGIDVRPYAKDGSHFEGVTRQVLFEAGGCELRYFEIEPGGHSALERHDHVHAVMVVRGSGRCLVGTELHDLGTNDLISVPPGTWHQFRAPESEPLGFLCLVPAERDTPRRPDSAELEVLRADPAVAAFIRV